MTKNTNSTGQPIPPQDRLCTIFCLDKSVHLDDEYSHMIDWAYQHPNNDTVLILSEQTVADYAQKGLWHLITQETDYQLLGAWEDDWIFDFDVMTAIIQALEHSEFQQDEIVLKIIQILRYAISYQRSVVFYL